MPTPEHPVSGLPFGSRSPGVSRLVYHTKSGRKATAQALAEHAERNGDWPVQRVEIFPRDVRVKKIDMFGADRGTKKVGSIIVEFSDRSRRALAFFVANCGVNFRSMMTVTYPMEFPCDGAIVKAHLRALRKRVKRRFKEFPAVWFLEFQMRGAPHFHVLCALELVNYGEAEQRKRWKGKRKGSVYWTVRKLEEWLAKAWYEIVGSGDEKHLRAGVSWEVIEKEDGAQRYAWKHASKPHQKEVPAEYVNVGRFWGAWGIAGLDHHLVAEMDLDAGDVFDLAGHEALSSKGRIKKDLYGAAEKFIEVGE